MPNVAHVFPKNPPKSEELCNVPYRYDFVECGVVCPSPKVKAWGLPLFGHRMSSIFSYSLHIWRPYFLSASWVRASLWRQDHSEQGIRLNIERSPVAVAATI